MSIEKVEAAGIEFAYRWDGNPDGPVVMMAHAMGTSHRIWDWQVPALEDRYRLLRYDWRGHGDSDAPPGPYTLSQFVSDAVAVMDALDLRTVHWVGISTGGMIGQGLGIHHPGTHRLAITLQHDLAIDRMVSRMGEGAPGGRERRRNGAGLGDDRQACGLPTPTRTPPTPTIMRSGTYSSKPRCPGYLGGTSAVADLAYLPDLPKIKAPTRIIAAADDPVTPIVRSEEMRDGIPGAKLTVIDGQRHFSNVEVPDEFNPVLRDGLDDMLEEIER